MFNAEEKARLFQNIAAAMRGVPDAIIRRQTVLFTLCDPASGAALRLVLPDDHQVRESSR